MTAPLGPGFTPDRIAFAGDWHRNATFAEAAIAHAADARVDVVIQLGDFGVWQGTRGDTYLDAVASASITAGVPVLFIDGNHENFELLERYPVDASTGTRPLRDGITHLPRGTRWVWGGVSFCALGGATSLDRPRRVPAVSWWPQEEITYAQARSVASGGACDVLLTHDCPEGVPIPGIDRLSSLRQWPEAELRRAWAHRELLAEVCAELRPSTLLHGHFHVRHTTEVSAFAGRTTVHGLGDDQGDVTDNVAVFTLDELRRRPNLSR